MAFFGRPSLIPELDSINQQMFMATDPSQTEQLQTALTQARQRLATIDKTNLQQYAGAMEQVVILSRRLESNVTPQSLLTQRVSILEGLVSKMSPPTV
jgi:hypothetical protein